MRLRGRQLPPRGRAAAGATTRRSARRCGDAGQALGGAEARAAGRLDAEDAELLVQVVATTRRRSWDRRRPWSTWSSGASRTRELISRFRLGFADRTLGLRLPAEAGSRAGRSAGRLQRLGVFRESGHEHFNGSLVIPVFDRGGRVVELYGRKISDDLRKGTPVHLYLPGPHRGVLNLAAPGRGGGDPLRVADRRADLLARRLPERHRRLRGERLHRGAPGGLPGARVRRVLVAYDRDDAGDKAAAKLAERSWPRASGSSGCSFPAGWTPTSTRSTAAGRKALALVLPGGLAGRAGSDGGGTGGGGRGARRRRGGRTPFAASGRGRPLRRLKKRARTRRPPAPPLAAGRGGASAAASPAGARGLSSSRRRPARRVRRPELPEPGGR